MLKQSLNYKLLQKLSPQQIQLMKLIQLPTQAFEQRLSQEIEENPALESGKEVSDNIDETLQNEFDDDDGGNENINADDINIDEYLSDDEIPNYKTQSNNYSSDDEDKHIPYASGITFTQHLKNQINTYRLNENEGIITDFLVGSIDDSGYIRRDLHDILDDLAFTQNVFTTESELKRLLKIVQQLDPSGVGARDLRECLLIQLRRKEENSSRTLAIDILDNSFEHFVKKHYDKLIQKFHVSENDLKAAIKEIEKLNPKPGGSFMGNNKIAEITEMHLSSMFPLNIIIY
jgi:RNA polymerase sigma-54 factor